MHFSTILVFCAHKKTMPIVKSTFQTLGRQVNSSSRQFSSLHVLYACEQQKCHVENYISIITNVCAIATCFSINSCVSYAYSLFCHQRARVGYIKASHPAILISCSTLSTQNTHQHGKSFGYKLWNTSSIPGIFSKRFMKKRI